MSKKVLAIYYSQSGQLGEIIDNFTAPLIGPDVTVEKVRIRPVEDYAFPWTDDRFYGIMPDCVLGATTPLAPFTLKESSYDLIILGYQAWFLYPSIPSNSLLQHPDFKAIVKDTPVITITGARNMWLNAFEAVKKLLSDAGARLVGNIALVDRHPNVISFVTILHWLMGGKKDRQWNIFPRPGVSHADIDGTKTFGNVVLPYLHNKDWQDLQPDLLRHKAVELKYPLWLMETTAVPTYVKWAQLLVKKKKRTIWLAAFKYYILIALFIGAPILLIIDAVFIKPFSSRRIKQKKQYYLALN
jgi:hypothetical protein